MCIGSVYICIDKCLCLFVLRNDECFRWGVDLFRGCEVFCDCGSLYIDSLYGGDCRRVFERLLCTFCIVNFINLWKLKFIIGN